MLVALEGLDGSGKTTVCDALRANYPDAVVTGEPTETWYGDAVRRSLADDDADPLAECFLYTADHAAHLSAVVRPALERGELVISDRYVDSRYAYQGASLEGIIEDPMAYVRSIHRPFTREPDLTVYLDVDPETAVERSDADDKFERADHLATVRDNYERLMEAEPERFVRVDAERPPETVANDVEAALEDALAE